MLDINKGLNKGWLISSESILQAKLKWNCPRQEHTQKSNIVIKSRRFYGKTLAIRVQIFKT